MVRVIYDLHGDNAFRSYDEQFRMLRELVNIPWQHTIQELRLKATTATSVPIPLKLKLSPLESAFVFNTTRVNGAIRPSVPFDTVVCNAKAIIPNPDA